MIGITSQKRSMHVSFVRRKPERILRNPKAAPTDRTLVIEAFSCPSSHKPSLQWLMSRYSRRIVWASCGTSNRKKNSRWGYRQERSMPEIRSVSKFGYSGPTDLDVHRSICKALEVHGERKIRRIIDESCEKVFLALFEESHEQAKRNVYAPVSGVMEQAVVKSFCKREADHLLNDTR